MRTDIDQYVRDCPVCATTKPKPGKPYGLLQSVADPSSPWEEIAMDFIVDLPPSRGYTVIWTVIDLFSRQAHFIPCKGLPSAKKLARLFLQHIYRLHGVPKRIISDRGVQFTAMFWKTFIHSIGSSQGLSSAYHPSTNGAAERANAMIERYLRAYVTYQQDDWSDLLPFAETAYNNAVHRSTGYTPYRIVSGKDFPAIPELDLTNPQKTTPTDWIRTIQTAWPHVKAALNKAAIEYKQQADKHRKPYPSLRIGDPVYLSTKYLKLKTPSKKLSPKYIGPFPITKIINPVAIRLALPPRLRRIHPVFHVSLIKPATGVQNLYPRPGPVAGGQYEVRDIIDSRIHHKTLQYLIRWKGYPDSDATWVKEKDIDAPRALRKYHKSYPQKPGGRLYVT